MTTMPMGPTEEAAYALDFGVSRSDLSPTAQEEYDRMVAANEAYRTSAGRPLTKEERKQARRERHEEFRRRLELAEETAWLPNLGVAVRDGNVYQHGADRGESGFDARASRERRDPAQLRLLGPLAGLMRRLLPGRRRSAAAAVTRGLAMWWSLPPCWVRSVCWRGSVVRGRGSRW
jgi:hypothetical protein